jgi:hypothetical protein
MTKKRGAAGGRAPLFIFQAAAGESPSRMDLQRTQKCRRGSDGGYPKSRGELKKGW